MARDARLMKEEPLLNMSETNRRPCADGQGTLPSCAPLAVPYVPFQQSGSQTYSQQEALANGTLFPGLNLPFQINTVAATPAQTGALELQALSFVLTELGMYLDTHPEDKEAFELFREYGKLAREGRRRYEAMYGPLTQQAAADRDQYTWLDDPWPWEYRQEGGNR